MLRTPFPSQRLALLAAAGLGLAGSASAHVSLLDPNGGQVLQAGSVYRIRWRVDVGHDTQAWHLHYSTTGSSGPWIPIAVDLPPGNTSTGDINTYDWTVPNTPSTSVRVRVIQDNGSRDYQDISSADLTITGAASPATYATIAPGCAGSAGTPSLDGEGGSLPSIGTTFRVELGNLPAAGAGAFLVTGFQQLVPPTDLGPHGLSGCSWHVSPLDVAFVANQGGTADWQLAIPNDPALAGFRFRQQAFVPDPQAGNAAGASVSDAAEATIN